jgi:hypothetical protein
MVLLLASWASGQLVPAAKLKASIVELPGISSQINNIAYAFGKYILVAPFAPSQVVSDTNEGESDLSRLDNHYLYSIDVENPSAPPRRIDLGCYYPSRLFFDEPSQTVFVRATQYIQLDQGEFQAAEVIAYVRLRENGDFEPTVIRVPIKAVDGDPTEVKIPGTNDKWASSAPYDFALGRDGKMLVFTNGASIFTYSVMEGYILQKVLIPSSDYSLDYSISGIQVDRQSNTLAVTVNQRIVKKKGIKRLSELYFYRLTDIGTLILTKHVPPEAFPEGTALSDGSTLAFSIDPESGTPSRAFFVTDDGSLCSVDLDEASFIGQVSRLAIFPEMAATSDDVRGPRFVEYYQAKRTLGIVKPGYTLQIKRPLHNRPGKIKRPLHLHLLEAPVLAMTLLNKKGWVADSRLFTDFGPDEVAISNPIFTDQDSMIATSTGKLYSVSFDSPSLSYLGDLGFGINSISSFNGSRLVGLKSFDADDQTGMITDPGAIVIAELDSRAAGLAALTPLSLKSSWIRRPCGVGKR